jgi:hypothetical protein
MEPQIMTRFSVFLRGTTPLLMNSCRFDFDGLYVAPKSDRQTAARKLYRAYDGSLTLPRWSILYAIANKGRDSRVKAVWPVGVNDLLAWDGLQCGPIAFRHEGEWTVHAIRDDGGRGRLGRIYPRFDHWSASFVLSVDESRYEPAVVRSLLSNAGVGRGLSLVGDRLASAGWGRFAVEEWDVESVRCASPSESAT